MRKAGTFPPGRYRISVTMSGGRSSPSTRTPVIARPSDSPRGGGNAPCSSVPRNRYVPPVGSMTSRTSRFSKRDVSKAVSEPAAISRNTVLRSGPATEEIRGTKSQSKSPSTKSTIDSSMSVKPGLLRIPGVDVRILAFPALHPVRPVGADVVIPVRAGGDVHVVVAPGILRYPVEVPSLPVILRDPADLGGPHEGRDLLLGCGVETVVELEELQGLLDVLDLETGLGPLRLLRPPDQLGDHERREKPQYDDDDHDFQKGERAGQPPLHLPVDRLPHLLEQVVEFPAFLPDGHHLDERGGNLCVVAQRLGQGGPLHDAGRRRLDVLRDHGVSHDGGDNPQGAVDGDPARRHGGKRPREAGGRRGTAAPPPPGPRAPGGAPTTRPPERSTRRSARGWAGGGRGPSGKTRLRSSARQKTEER